MNNSLPLFEIWYSLSIKPPKNYEKIRKKSRLKGIILPQETQKQSVYWNKKDAFYNCPENLWYAIFPHLALSARDAKLRLSFKLRRKVRKPPPKNRWNTEKGRNRKILVMRPYSNKQPRNKTVDEARYLKQKKSLLDRKIGTSNDVQTASIEDAKTRQNSYATQSTQEVSSYG